MSGAVSRLSEALDRSGVGEVAWIGRGEESGYIEVWLTAADADRLIGCLGRGQVVTVEAAGAVPDDVIEEVRKALYDGPDSMAKSLYRRRVESVLSVPSVAEVFARDAKVRELREDVTWLAKLAQGSSWPGEMAHRVQRAADRVVHEFGTDADRAAIAALYSEDGTR